MEILISYAPYRHQRYSSTNFPKRTAVWHGKKSVCFPYEFTLLSNNMTYTDLALKFVSPTNLHCSQTSLMSNETWFEFVSPTNLHCSQTLPLVLVMYAWFVSPTNLHCSQTPVPAYPSHLRLFPLRIYTALKPNQNCDNYDVRLFPLRIYTALKLTERQEENLQCLFPLRIYTALKRCCG